MLHWEACGADSLFGNKLAPEKEWIAWFKDVMSSTGFSVKHNSTNSNKVVATANMKSEIIAQLDKIIDDVNPIYYQMYETRIQI